jgi:hypothetical protein
MFRPSQPLQKRTPLRLKGYRGPSTRILRSEIAKLSPGARQPAFSGPDRPLEKRRAEDDSHAIKASDGPLTFGELLAACRARPFGQPRRCGGTRRRGGSAAAAAAASRWTSSVHLYNQAHMPWLPVVTDSAKVAIRAYLNMLPRHVRLDGICDPVLFRAHVADRTRRQQRLGIRQDLLGKLSRSQAFWRLWRKLKSWEPPVLFKHFNHGSATVSLWLYDGRIDTLRRKIREVFNRI